MHARIYQISLKNKHQDDWITEHSISDTDMGSLGIDYTAPSRNRNEDLELLKIALPTDMFSMNGNEVTLLNDGTDVLRKALISIRGYVNGITEDGYINSGMFEDRITSLSCNVLNVNHLFYIDDDSEPVRSTEFIRYCHALKPGTKLYINGILDYHF